MTSNSQIRSYQSAKCVSFRRTREEFGGLSNMAGGYPLEVNGISIPSAEALYQACRFPHLLDIQKLILEQKSPMTAKMVSKPHRVNSRQDWNQVRVRVMRWVLRVKLAAHWKRFGGLLLKTDGRSIVEDSRRDNFWGALPQEDRSLIGMNVLGRLLMELREELKESHCDDLKVVAPPDISDFMLLGKPISEVISEGSDGVTDPDLLQQTSLWNTLFTEEELRNTACESDSHAQPAPMDKTMTERRPSLEYPKRLIEVDLPIKRISAHARREKSIRHGHISTLHIWWARRPLAACRAVTCAALWPDPVDEQCPDSFLAVAHKEILKWAHNNINLLSEESASRFIRISKSGMGLEDREQIRDALLDFIADYSSWANSIQPEFVRTGRTLTEAAFEGYGNPKGESPLIVDPFAGGGSIPLEALRLGADAFASDLNPMATILNKVLLEYFPKYGSNLGKELSVWASKVSDTVTKELSEYYPVDPQGATPLAYLWARTIKCEGPSCGFILPLVRTLSLTGSFRLELCPNESNRCFNVHVRNDSSISGTPTISNGSATCPRCGFTTGASSVRIQLKGKMGGVKDAQLLAVYVESDSHRYFRQGTDADIKAANTTLSVYESMCDSFPDAPINPIRPYKNTRGLSAVTRIGMDSFLKLYTPRQALALRAFTSAVERLADTTQILQTELGVAVYTILSLAAGRIAHQNSSLSRWQNNRSTIAGAFSKQALQITWDFAEGNPISTGAGSWDGAIKWIIRIIDRNLAITKSATTANCPAKKCPIPDDAADAIITDPPYFAAIPYADLSDFFYVWIAPVLRRAHSALFSSAVVDQTEEAIVTNAHNGPSGTTKDPDYYTQEMTLSLSKACNICKSSGIAVIVFADSSAESWEAILEAVISGGWIITASWPLDTELQSRTQAANAASLQSSVHMVCRPRDTSVRVIGDWRDVLRELPERIHDWMPRLASEGVVGADAIFACLGPALEIYSRYESVERANGKKIELKEYLEEVWAAVSKEALNMVFKGADASGFEEDSRLTAMWLWTLSAGSNGDSDGNGEDSSVASTGYTLEYDAARKIAQGLGAHLDRLQYLVEIKGDKARLLPVSERTAYLFGKENSDVPRGKRKKKDTQTKMAFLTELEEAEEQAQFEGTLSHSPGSTVLDRIHQSMILFAAGRGEALKRFLVEEGIGRDPRFWKLAQALSALYPKNVDEKRWVDGVLAKKKGFGL